MTTEARLSVLATFAASLVENGMDVGLGSGSTAEAVVRALGERVAGGLKLRGVSTSARTTRLAESCGVPLVAIDDVARLDLGIDGADEIDPHLNLVKGRGGALLREKLVARTCDRWIIVAASEKLVSHLGTRTPLPVEVVPFGWSHTSSKIEGLGCQANLRLEPGSDMPFHTDGGNLVLDCVTGPIFEPESFGHAIKSITGVVDHGIFAGMADQAITVNTDGEVAVHAAPNVSIT